MQTIHLKRVYEKPSPEDGYRVLVDRIWPRGISKQEADIAEWDKDLAPSTELRKWFIMILHSGRISLKNITRNYWIRVRALHFCTD